MKKYTILFFLGLVSAFAFQPYSQVWLLPVTFSVLFYFINKIITFKKLFWLGFSFGAGIGAAGMFWLINALLIDVAQFGWLIPVIPIGFGLFFGLFYGGATALCCFSPLGVRRWLAFAGAFVLTEWVRSWICTGFPWNTLGGVWTACLPILQSASVIGVLGLSGVSILWFCSPYFLWHKKSIFALSALSFIVLFGMGYLRLLSAQDATVWGVKLRLVQANIPQTLKWDRSKSADNLMAHIRLSKQGDKVTHVLWPEAATPYLFETDHEARAMTISALSQGATLITGALRQVGQAYANSALVINDMGQTLASYDKSHLVPFGEYVPLRGILPWDKFVPISSDLQAGSGVKTIPIPNAPPAGILICYEIIFSGAATDKNNRPQWLINPTNDGWYGLSAGPYQHLAAAQLRAVEEGLPVVRVAGSGISAVINPFGRIVKSLPLGEQGVLDSPLPRALSPTLFHPTIPWVCGLLLIVVNVKKRKK